MNLLFLVVQKKVNLKIILGLKITLAHEEKRASSKFVYFVIRWRRRNAGNFWVGVIWPLA